MAHVIASTEELADELRARGLAAADSPDPGAAAPGTDRPWYIGLLLGVAGWFAGIFLLIFVFLLFKPTSGGAALVVGVVLLASAWGLFMADHDGAFVSQLALALSIAGQCAVVVGLVEPFFKGKSEFAGIAFVALLLQLALLFAMPNRLHRTMSTLFACAAWAVCVRYALKSAPAMGWALAWLPVAAALFALVRAEPAWMAAGRQALARPAATGLIAALAVATLLSYPLESLDWFTGAPHARGAWFALWPLLSALAALAALVGAFALGSRGLMGICVVAALLHVTHFYYVTSASLLVKSLTLLVLGALLLGAAYQIKRSAPA